MRGFDKSEANSVKRDIIQFFKKSMCRVVSFCLNFPFHDGLI